jgi:hypothetical protein
METHNNQYALISFDNTNLLIPQTDVSTIETLDRVSSSSDGDNEAVGQLQMESGSWPVFSISADFIKLHNKRDFDRYCVCFKHPEHGLFGLICNAVSSFQYDDNNIIYTDLPEMMYLPQSPIQKLLYYQKSLYLISNVTKLYQSLVEVH